VVILAGFAARSAGAAGFVEVAAAAWLGMMLGTIVDYWLGRVAGSRLVPRRAPWRLAYRWQRLLRASHAFMARWGWWAIVVANLAGPGRSSIAVAAGASRWSFGAFLAGQAPAAAGWCLLYCGLGYSAAAEARRLESVAGGFGLAVVALFLAVVAGPWLASLVLRLVVRWLRPRLRADSPAGPRSLSPAAVEPPPAPPLPGG
jgi:membrane protein DedA with SNARE-associated domain